LTFAGETTTVFTREQEETDVSEQPPVSERSAEVTVGTFRRSALVIARAAALVANYCDHAEHNEALDRSWVAEAAQILESEALLLASAIGVGLIDTYAERLQSIEAANVFSGRENPDGAAAARRCTSWRDLQLVQAEHDRYYHPDVSGLSKSDQLRHYAFHLAKLVGAFAASDDLAELCDRRLPDTLLFAIKLRTVMGKRLPDDPLPRH
jgi:hypothetical protein